MAQILQQLKKTNHESEGTLSLKHLHEANLLRWRLYRRAELLNYHSSCARITWRTGPKTFQAGSKRGGRGQISCCFELNRNIRRTRTALFSV